MKFSEQVSASVPDWTREECRSWWDPGRQLLRAIRQYQYWKKRENLISKVICGVSNLQHKFWSVITGAEIPLNCQIEGGLLIPHPNGIVIHPDAVIGPNSLIFQQVTIGTGTKPGLPKIGGHVDIGCGAKILGGVTIGNHVKIGANAVVVSDIPDNCTAIGIPAKFMYND